MTYSHIKLFIKIFFALLISFVFVSSAIADCVLTPQQILRDDVLVVVNDNSISSPEVGDYYCEQRGIDPANVAHVRVPVTNDVEHDQFISLRDQLIKHMQENTLPTGVVPIVCDITQGYTLFYCPESMTQLSQQSKIRYVVMTKGLPIRFSFPSSTLDGSPHIPSIDNYLRFWLSDYFSEDVAFSVNFNDRAVDFGDGRGMREVNPKVDRELIVGRIDGVDVESAKNLVDRAIDAEKSGIFGKLYGNKFGGSLIRKSLVDGAFWKRWKHPFSAPGDDSSNSKEIYPKDKEKGGGWHYLHGLFGEIQGLDEPTVRHTTNPECASHDANGRIPKQCVVAVNRGSTGNIDDNTIIREDLSPGNPDGRIPSPDNALVHQGFDDTFSSLIKFDHLLNWRDNATCKTLCTETLNVADCKATSTDAYKEINTSCVRVADGYIGYTFGSYPVGLMASWPTGWFQSINFLSNKFNQTGSEHYYFWQPEVRDDIGFNDDFSLWYRNADENPSALCYTDQGTSSGQDYQALPGGDCKLDKRISINQTVDISARLVDTVDPQKITIRFKYRAIDLANNVNISARLTIRESVYNQDGITIISANQLDYGNITIQTFIAPNDPIGSVWGDASVTFTLDPARHIHPDKSFDGLRISINVPAAFEGELAFDDFSVDEDGIDIPLVNPSFDDGHRQLSGGDSAATFLSRLNGLAFWGNVSHHEFNGHSFERSPYEALIYFLRGIPLGDAVWFAEFHNSGLFYGDPIYSPIAIHMDYLSASDDRAPDDHFNRVADSPLALTGDTHNGSGADVTTTYSVDYCTGNDFFICDQDSDNRWLSIDNMQALPGGQRGMQLGNWNISNFAEGDYVLRLAVTSNNSTKNLTQTFYDYYDVTIYSPETTVDFDSDGLSYQEEVDAGTNPWSDDTDSDGLPDFWEVSNGVDALTYSADADSDGGGVNDTIEFLRGTDPLNSGDEPVVSILEVDSVNGVDNGLSPFKLVRAAISSAQAGDTILLLPGKHAEVVVDFNVPVQLQGSPGYSATLNTKSFISSAAGVVTLSGLVIKTANTEISSNTPSSLWRFNKNNIIATVRTNSGSLVEFRNNLFTGASGDAINVLEESSVVIINNTLTGNNVGVRAEVGSRVQIINSIIAENIVADIIGVSSGSITYSLTGDSSLAGINGNISGDPQFVDSVGGNYHLKPESLAIDAGDPQSNFSQEPAAKIGRINMGQYGNTSEATTAVENTSGGGTPEPSQGSSSGQMHWLLILWFSLYGLLRLHNKHRLL